MDPRTITDIAASDCTAHAGCALLVTTVLEADRDGGRVAIDTSQGRDGLQLLEAGAQAIAASIGAWRRASGSGQASAGMLVGAKGFRVERCLARGDTATATVSRAHALPPMELWHVTIDCDGEAVASGELKIAHADA